MNFIAEDYSGDREETLKAVGTNLHSAWRKYNALDSKARPTPRVLATHLMNVARIDLKFAAFISLLYLSACRASEILPYHPKHPSSRRNLPPMMSHNIVIHIIDGREFVQIMNPILKQKELKVAYATNKFLPLTELNSDAPFWNIFFSWCTQLGLEWDEYNKCWNKDITLFENYQYQQANGRLRKYFPELTLHAFRKYRCKSLCEDNDFLFSGQQLQAFVGWKDPKMAYLYSRANKDSIIKSLISNNMWDKEE